MSENQQYCPICQTAVYFSPRYPRHLCVNCASRARSKDGRLLKFSNESVSGGYVAQYADTGEPYRSHECYVDGIQCHADEDYWDEIVIQPA